MAKHRNKKRAKLQKLYEELKYCQSLNYYHQPEDEADIKRKIKMVEETLR